MAVMDALDRVWIEHYRHPRGPYTAGRPVRAVLAELAAHPGRCTTELGALIGNQGNASRLLARLETVGLVRSEEEPNAAGGRPYRYWRLSPDGAKLARLDGQP